MNTSVNGSCPLKGRFHIYPASRCTGILFPSERVGGDLFEYINFQQRYDVDARIRQALKLSKEFLDPLPPGAPPRNSVDDHVEWLKSRPDYQIRNGSRIQSCTKLGAGTGRRSSQRAPQYCRSPTGGRTGTRTYFGEDCLDRTRYVSCVSCSPSLISTERTTPELFENINLRLAQSVTARNALGDK